MGAAAAGSLVVVVVPFALAISLDMSEAKSMSEAVGVSGSLAGSGFRGETGSVVLRAGMG